MGLRSTGALESLELAAYDWCLRLQPEPPGEDPRIVLIQITERDIRVQQRWPLTDRTLAQALEHIAQARPRAIGLDIFRDIPVPPGGEELAEVLQNNPNIIAMMKFGSGGEDTVPPPSVLKHTEQVGANDIVVDPDGVVRRGLLFLDDGKTTAYSFALRLALLYLQAEGVVPQPDQSNPEHLRLGRISRP
jgi:CHASE2 domain-containing sensor protein